MAEDAWGIFGIVSAVLIVIAGIYFAVNRGNWSGISSALGTLFFAITNFIPFGIITFGLIADLIGQEFRYSIGSIVGFLSILLNFLLAKSLGLGVDTTSTTEAANVMGWCLIPGLENLESKMLPMNIVSSSSIMMYYLIFAASKRTSGQNISIYVAFPLIFLLQLVTFFGGGCDKYYIGGIGSKIGAFVFGSILGVIGWAIVNYLFPAYVPFLTYGDAGGRAPASGYGSSRPPMSPGVGGAPPSGAKCSQDNSEDGDEFVCEAYKNGVLVTEQISK